MEGEATERLYLEDMRARLKRRPAAMLVHHSDPTDPLGIVREAIRLREARCHNHWETAGGDGNPSTHLDKLIEELNDSSPVRLF